MRMNRLFPSLAIALLSLHCYAACTDTVGDGICNFWRLAYFGNGVVTNSVSCAACDPDGDGVSNLQEFQLLTDPTDSSSPFRILSISPSGNDISITWAAAVNHTNVLEASLGTSVTLDTNAFYGISTNFASGVGVVTNNYVDIGAGTNTVLR